jgi:hypothetical protein
MSCPHTSPQDGWVELMIRNTTNMLCCLLFQASLLTRCWVEALNTATYLLNRLPSKAASHLTPFFALFSTNPTYEHLHVFGCAYYHNTSAITPHKLAPRSTRCLFLGCSFDYKGYRCLNLLTHRIVISRHVVFDEDVFPLASSSPPLDLNSILDIDYVDIPCLPLPSSAPCVATLPLAVPSPVTSACTTCCPVAYTMRGHIASAGAARGPIASAYVIGRPIASAPTACGPVASTRVYQRLDPSVPYDGGPHLAPTRSHDESSVYQPGAIHATKSDTSSFILQCGDDDVYLLYVETSCSRRPVSPSSSARSPPCSTSS